MRGGGFVLHGRCFLRSLHHAVLSSSPCHSCAQLDCMTQSCHILAASWQLSEGDPFPQSYFNQIPPCPPLWLTSLLGFCDHVKSETSAQGPDSTRPRCELDQCAPGTLPVSRVTMSLKSSRTGQNSQALLTG